MIKGIVCVAKDYGIGKANGLLFNIPADMKHFRTATTGNICVFGYNTYMSLPKRPLKNRVNIVLWDKAPLPVETKDGAIFFNNFETLLNFVKILSKEYDVYICGGAGVYAAFLDYYDVVDITFVDAIDEEATAFFPNLVKNGYIKAEAEPYYKDESTNGYSISKQLWVRPVEESEMSL